MHGIIKFKREIKRRYRMKAGDTPPYVGWNRYSRGHLAKLFGDFGYKFGAEIGVCKGVFSEILVQNIPGVKLLSIDPWMAYHSSLFPNYISQKRCDLRYQAAVERLSKYPNVKIMRMTSLEAVGEVEDGSLDFVFIDGDHSFDNIMLDLILWSPKGRLGGIVAGHDYFEFYQSGVIAAVNAYTQAYGIRGWYVTRERVASFFWVKTK